MIPALAGQRGRLFDGFLNVHAFKVFSKYTAAVSVLHIGAAFASALDGIGKELTHTVLDAP